MFQHSNSMFNAQWQMRSMQFYEANSNTKYGDPFTVEIPKRDEKKRNREKIVVTENSIKVKRIGAFNGLLYNLQLFWLSSVIYFIDFFCVYGCVCSCAIYIYCNNQLGNGE